MNIKPLYREIPFDRIDLPDLKFSLTPTEDEELDQFRNLAAEGAIIHPPVLIENTNKLFTIVTGRRQIIAAHQVTDEDSCACLVMPSDTPPSDLLSMALQEILLIRPTTPIEKAACWQKVAGLLGRDRAIEKFGQQLDLSGQQTPERLEKLLTLDPEMQVALHNGNLEYKTSLKLLDLEQNDRKTLFNIILKLRLSASNQRRLVDSCRELKKRQGRSISIILSEPECLEIIDHPTANPPQKTAMLMSWLADKCFPRLNQAEKDFHDFTTKLALPKGVKIEHTPSFEKDSLKLTMEFVNRQELLDKWPAIRDTILGKK